MSNKSIDQGVLITIREEQIEVEYDGYQHNPKQICASGSYFSIYKYTSMEQLVSKIVELVKINLDSSYCFLVLRNFYSLESLSGNYFTFGEESSGISVAESTPDEWENAQQMENEIKFLVQKELDTYKLELQKKSLEKEKKEKELVKQREQQEDLRKLEALKKKLGM